MPRQLSSEAVRSLLGEHTQEVFLITLRISGTGFAPLYLVNNLESITVEGQVYIPFPFSIVLPNESKDKPPRATLRIDNLSQEIIEKLRSLQGRPTFELAVRLASTPDVIEVGPITLDSSAADWNDTWVDLTLTSKNLLNEPWPSKTFSPISYPGLFQ